ncbi:MarR family transcriptional regulator [Proteiniborus sp.]|uniref:MarR family winged helix-turn-helix transcriptional regulator n=1 Tax=Proteiniborus sp. TaxID=2079015 RepID=UPI0033299FF4
MDSTQRKITKIAREALRFTSKVLKDTGLGLSEYEFIHCIRHNPGISQEGLREKFGLDKSAVARRAANLEKKGFIERKPDPNDGRGKQLFATEQANTVKNSKVLVESFFYEWLLQDVTGEEREIFLTVLDRIYWKSKNERRADFKNLIELEANCHGKFEA